MRKMISLLMIIAFVLAFGCSKQAEPAPASAPASAPEPASAPVPEMTPVQPVEEEVVHPPTEEPEEVAPIGNIVSGEGEEGVEEEVPENITEIKLNPDKTMSLTEKTVKVGTKLAWKNYDLGWPHQLAVESGSGWDTKRHALSERLLDNEVFEYTFNEKGTFLVRDIFSGKMRMTVTVE